MATLYGFKVNISNVTSQSKPEEKGLLEEIGQPVKPPTQRDIRKEMNQYIDDVENSLDEALDKLRDEDVANVS